MKENRRKFPRSPVHLLVKYKCAGSAESSQPVISVSKDIGMGGIKLRLKESPPLGQIIIAQINIPAFERPVNVVLKALWARASGEPGFFDVGTEFVNIHKDDRSDFLDYISFINKSSSDSGSRRKSGNFFSRLLSRVGRK